MSLLKERLRPLGFIQETSLSASKLLSAMGTGIPQNARAVLIRPTVKDVVWRDDGGASGTAPTATVGIPLLTTDAPLWYTGDMTALRFIEVAASAKLNIAYYG